MLLVQQRNNTRIHRANRSHTFILPTPEKGWFEKHDSETGDILKLYISFTKMQYVSQCGETWSILTNIVFL
jgi:hypothetical protein